MCAPGVDEGPFYVTSEWSYRAQKSAHDGLVLAGDARGFLDPVFSSGVLLALRSGELAAEAVDAALAAGDVSAGRFEEYGSRMDRSFGAMRRLVHAFYDDAFSMRGFINEYPHMHGEVTDCLMGNLSRNFDELFAALETFIDGNRQMV